VVNPYCDRGSDRADPWWCDVDRPAPQYLLEDASLVTSLDTLTVVLDPNGPWTLPFTVKTNPAGRKVSSDR
jgi:hypothetical protein